MNTTVSLTDQLNRRQQLSRWRARLLPVWSRYWPLLLMATGLLWLGLSLNHQSLEGRIARYNDMVTGKTSLDNPSRVFRAVNPDSAYFKAGLRAGAAMRLLLSVLLPYLLLLTAIGQYQYWYVSRPVLLAPGSGVKWAYGFGLFIIWFILLSISMLGFGKEATLSGVSNAFSYLTVGYLVAWSMVTHLRERQREDRELVQAERQAELDALKAQVNPPFLFHALQGLHETAVAENLPRTTQSLDQLTGIMQYVLEESRHQTTDVAREMGFIRDYLRLQQLRVPDRDNIRITTDLDWDGQPACIVPLLLNPLIENAFKYGISMQHPCFVAIRLRIAGNILVFTAENSVLPRNDLERGTGLGLKNVRRRLELAYPDRHKLTIADQDGVYRVEVKIKLI